MECDDPNLFAGIRFHLAGFNTHLHHQVKGVLEKCGGVYVDKYCADCTHVIVYKLLIDDPICVTARRDGKALVTSTWIDHSVNARELADVSSIIYRPLKEPNGIPGAKDLVICLTGYVRLQREDIMTMVDLMGADFSRNLVPNKATHLICYKFEGAKYVAAQAKNVKLVNHQWLEDCLKAWKILPEKPYCISSYELEMMEAVIEDSEDEKNLPVQQSNNEQIVMRTPVKSSHPLHVGEELGNLSRSSKRSAESLVEYSTPTKAAKRLNVYERILNSSDIKTKDYLESEKARASASAKGLNSKGLFEFHADKHSPSSLGRSSISLESVARSNSPQHLREKAISDLAAFNVESNKKVSASELSGGPSTATGLHDLKGSFALPQSKQQSGLSDVSCIIPKLRKLTATASKRIDASESATPVTSPLKKSKSSAVSVSSHKGTARVSEDKSSTDVLSRSLAFEKMQDGKSDNTDTRTSPISVNLLYSSSGVKNKTAEPQILPEKVSVSPELKKLEASKSGNCNLNSDDHASNSASKASRYKTVARKKKLGSRPKASNKTADAQKGSYGGNLFNNERNDHSADKLMPALTVEEPPQNPTDDTNDDTDDPSDFFIQHRTSATKTSHLTKTIASATPGKDEINNSPSSNTCKPTMEHAKQNLAQKKEISGKVKGKGVISAPKDVVQNADEEYDIGGKSSTKNDSVKEQIVSTAGKKRRKGQLEKDPEQVKNKTVDSYELGACNVGKSSGKSDLNKRQGTLLKKSNTPIEVEKETEFAHDKDSEHDGDKQPVELSSTSSSSQVIMEVENNGACPENGVDQTLKKIHDTTLLSKTKPGKLSAKSTKGKKICRKKGPVLNKAEQPAKLVKENELHSHVDEVKSISEAIRKEPSCFIVSGHRLQRKEFQQLIKRLRGKHCRDSHQWSYQATHFIVPDPIRRTEKFFAAAASGRWILKTDFLTASIQAGKLLPEEPYEWHKNGLSEDGAISLEAPRKWRLLREKTGHGAFYGMRIVVYGECIAPTLETLKRVIKAGGGTILATSPPYTKFLNSDIDFAITSPTMPRVDIWVQEFLSHKIPCVSADYLVEYVCKPGYPLDKHVHYNTHEWATKSFERLSNLSVESIDDIIPPENQENKTSDKDIACQVCGACDRAEVMLVCGDESSLSGCGVGTHIDCCDPPFAIVPDGDWFCPKCTNRKTVSNPK